MGFCEYGNELSGFLGRGKFLRYLSNFCHFEMNFSFWSVSTRVTTREHPAAEGGTVGEECPANFA
jgi:hypothetical protein